MLSRELLDLVSAVKKIVRHELNGEPSAPTLTQARMLHKIKDGTRNVGKLSDAFGISQPATSIMVNTMVKQGFLRREPHPTDRRQIELKLTPKADTHLKSVYQRAFSKLHKKLSALSNAKKKAVTHQIREITFLLSQPDSE